MAGTDRASGGAHDKHGVESGGRPRPQTRAAPQQVSRTDAALALQRSIGNRAAAQILEQVQRSPAERRAGPVASPVPMAGRELRVDRWSPFGGSSKKTFQNKQFKRDLFVPSTGIGRFGLRYDAKSGDLEVIVRLRFEFTDVDAAWASKASAADAGWTDAKKQQWVTDYKSQIASVWGNISEIRCTKPGWDDVVARPRIVIEETKSKSKSHYNVKVDKGFTNIDTGKWRTSGGSTSVGSADDPKAAAFQEQDVKDKINDPVMKNHLAGTERTTNVNPAYKRDRERLVDRLGKIPPIQFQAGTDNLVSPDQIADAADKLKDLRKDSALAGNHPIYARINVVPGESRGLETRRVDKIRTELTARGVTQEVRPVPVPGPTGLAAECKLDGGAESDEVKDAYFAQWKRVTVAHEFGHMLGLLDEYCPAVSPELLQMMVDEGKLMPGFTMTPEAKARAPQDESKQTAYAKLLKTQGMETPTWARPTSSGQEKSTSLMSGGFEILKQHYVTISEGLAKLTKGYVKADEWKIH
jgi:hypothetical protein